MANTQSINERLLKVLNSDKNQGYVIGLTGEWGIGKTHFWKNFYEEKRSELDYQKYAYISLFGIDSLDSLKYEIAIQTQATSTDKKDSKKNLKIKSLFTFITNNVKIPDIQSNGFALSIGQNIITGALFSLVKDTIICIDDLERKSDNLDIKDIMGLISHLKTEKNCKVVVILYQDKTDNQFQEYKEKVFNEIVHLTENFSIIKTIIDDDEMIDIYKEFYQKLAVKNIRFYERVKRDYQEITELVDDLSLASKKIILKYLLVIRFADFFPQTISYQDKNENFEFELNLELLSKLKENHQERTKNKALEKSALHNFFKGFVNFYSIDDWVTILSSYLIKYKLNYENIKQLTEINLISEEKLKAIDAFNDIKLEIDNIEAKPEFFNRLYKASLRVIPYKDLSTLNFCYKVIKAHDENSAQEFKQEVENYVALKIQNAERKADLDDLYEFGVAEDDVFKDFVKEQIENYVLKIDFKDFFLNPNNQRNNDDVKKAVNEITKDDLRDVIWADLRDYFWERKHLLGSIVQHGLFSKQKSEEVRQWILELLDENIKENPNNEIAVKLLLQDTENLTKFT